MLFQVCYYFCSSMCFCTVYKEQESPPSLSEFFQKLNKLLLSFSFSEKVNEAPRASCTKDICTFVFMIYLDDGMASSPSPSPHNKGNQAKCCFILCAHNKSFRTIIFCFSSGFFLNRAISSSFGF